MSPRTRAEQTPPPIRSNTFWQRSVPARRSRTGFTRMPWVFRSEASRSSSKARSICAGLVQCRRSICPGFRNISGTVTIDSTASEAEIQRLKDTVDQHCPVLGVLNNPVPASLGTTPEFHCYIVYIVVGCSNIMVEVENTLTSANPDEAVLFLLTRISKTPNFRGGVSSAPFGAGGRGTGFLSKSSRCDRCSLHRLSPAAR